MKFIDKIMSNPDAIKALKYGLGAAGLGMAAQSETLRDIARRADDSDPEKVKKLISKYKKDHPNIDKIKIIEDRSGAIIKPKFDKKNNRYKYDIETSDSPSNLAHEVGHVKWYDKVDEYLGATGGKVYSLIDQLGRNSSTHMAIGALLGKSKASLPLSGALLLPHLASEIHSFTKAYPHMKNKGDAAGHAAGLASYLGSAGSSLLLNRFGKYLGRSVTN